MRTREEELREIPHRPGDPAEWPSGIRQISLDEAGALGVDAAGNLYWHGKPVEIRRPLDLSFWQKFGAVIVIVFTVIGGLGALAQGWANYNDWACKVGWSQCAHPSDVNRQMLTLSAISFQ